MDDLVQWLRAQLDEDERIARAARGVEFCKDGRWVTRGPFEEGLGGIHSEAGEAILGEEENVPFAVADHASRHDPARVLREIGAKRDLLRVAKAARDYHETFTSGFASALEGTLRLFALAYADRPGYREEWRP
ncbi:hypothetical protein C9F11_37480 [Streptomyces sp. YIM 121038]|uniref:DUF6221 family protein n=1 Tax=Streptomyces sp. YIM 121038 TaxID=2136401 RepID=UPI0011102015|nr:DUF6221 family protein [Streptomyces sp. YIM 121038]QCX81079.1 hypothetical protein C9F11_37480 [Streptomyces sp. YIM 121038]